jgi:hypothetical protein
MDQIKEYILNKCPTLSDSLLTTYACILKNLYGKVFGGGLVNLDNFDDCLPVLSFLKDNISPNNRKTILCILVIITDNNCYRELILEDVRAENHKENCNKKIMCINLVNKQIQTNKIIQNKVRIPSSLYTMNLGSLSSYNNVCWNQMSDRAIPSIQKATIPTGYNNSLNGKHSSFTSSKPGSQTPGGIGCDIKHNSYIRYLNRLKGKSLKCNKCIPTNIISFNPAFPIL